MIIEVIRTYRKSDYTIGTIAIDGYKQPYNSMEPFDAGLDSVRDSVDVIKRSKTIHGKVAIPTGMYPVSLRDQSFDQVVYLFQIPKVLLHELIPSYNIV